MWVERLALSGRVCLLRRVRLPSSLPLLLLPLLLLAAASCGESFVAANTTVRSHAVNERSEPYWAGPWPDDRRLVDGKVPTNRFPRPGVGAYLINMLQSGDRLVSGWGLAAPAFVPLTGSIDPSTLPPTPAASRLASASVYLTAVTPGSPDFGLRHPADFEFIDAPTLYLTQGHTLAIRPLPGFPLEAKTTYAVVVTRRLKDAAGQPVGPEEDLWKVLHQKAEDPYYAPLFPALAALGEDPAQVAGAFLFTTQPVLDELLTLRDWLEAQSAPTLDGAKVRSQADGGFTVFEGTYLAPNLQHGTPPFSTEGGEFVFDDAGVPVPGRVEAMRVALCVPKGPVPQGGFPVVLYSHGTGGSYLSVVRDACSSLATVGIAAAGIDQVFHGPRGGSGGGCFGQDVELCFFNPVNIVAGRNNARQAALDNLMLRKMLASVVVPSSLDPDGREVRFSAQHVGFFGHSQGGLSGALYAAIDPHLSAAVLSGAGAHLTTTVLVRKDPFDIKALAEGPLVLAIEGRESLDFFHPAMALIQALGDVADPGSYGPYYVQRPQGAPRHLYVTSGLEDPYTSAATAEYLAASAFIPQLDPVGRLSVPHALLGLAPVTAPVSNDVASLDGRRSTAVFRQFPHQGHFPVFNDPSARRQWVAFFDAALHGREVVVVP